MGGKLSTFWRNTIIKSAAILSTIITSLVTGNASNGVKIDNKTTIEDDIMSITTDVAPVMLSPKTVNYELLTNETTLTNNIYLEILSSKLCGFAGTINAKIQNSTSSGVKDIEDIQDILDTFKKEIKPLMNSLGIKFKKFENKKINNDDEFHDIILNSYDIYGQTPLFVAASEGNLDLVKIILAIFRDAGTLEKNIDKETHKLSGPMISPLLIAIQGCQFECAELLLRNGADAFKRQGPEDNYNGVTPIDTLILHINELKKNKNNSTALENAKKLLKIITKSKNVQFKDAATCLHMDDVEDIVPQEHKAIAFFDFIARTNPSIRIDDDATNKRTDEEMQKMIDFLNDFFCENSANIVPWNLRNNHGSSLLTSVLSYLTFDELPDDSRTIYLKKMAEVIRKLEYININAKSNDERNLYQLALDSKNEDLLKALNEKIGVENMLKLKNGSNMTETDGGEITGSKENNDNKNPSNTNIARGNVESTALPPINSIKNSKEKKTEKIKTKDKINMNPTSNKNTYPKNKKVTPNIQSTHKKPVKGNPNTYNKNIKNR